VDTIFIPHRSLLAEFVRHDIRADRLLPSGIPVRQDFCRHWEKQEAKKMLHLPEDKKMVLLACGSMGCGKLEKSALFLLDNLPKDVFLTVLCGNNEQAYQQLLPHISERLHILSYTDIVGDLLSAADLYITKPGGLSVTEAIVKRNPLLLVDAVPGCESHNYDFLLKAGIARGASKWKQVPSLIMKALENQAETAEQISLMENYDAKNAAEVICKHVLSVCKYGKR
jgi:processive 1,2-diacylglycerol beta-glucosyltransferase